MAANRSIVMSSKKIQPPPHWRRWLTLGEGRPLLPVNPLQCSHCPHNQQPIITLPFVFVVAVLLLFPDGHRVALASRSKGTVDLCDYFRAIGKLDLHPECGEEDTPRSPVRNTSVRAPKADSSSAAEDTLPACSVHAHLVQCTAEADECPASGQLCTQSDHSLCCQEATQGIPVSHINAKPGNCPQPVGISTLQDGSTGCWLDTNCPGIQKCCLEPNPVAHTARRICRDPNGISSDSICTLPLVVGTCTAFVTRYYFDQSNGKCKPFQYSGCGGNANNFQSLQSCHSTCGLLGVKGTPSCPSEANAELNCLLPHSDACHTDSDCMGREGGQQPSCCMTKCGYRICYVYA